MNLARIVERGIDAEFSSETHNLLPDWDRNIDTIPETFLAISPLNLTRDLHLIICES